MKKANNKMNSIPEAVFDKQESSRNVSQSNESALDVLRRTAFIFGNRVKCTEYIEAELGGLQPGTQDYKAAQYKAHQEQNKGRSS